MRPYWPKLGGLPPILELGIVCVCVCVCVFFFFFKFCMFAPLESIYLHYTAGVSAVCVSAETRLSVFHNSAVYIFWSFVITPGCVWVG